MEVSKISRSELVAVVGGVLLAIGLFLPWYHLDNARDSIGSYTGPADITGWQAHTILRWLLLAAAAAPLILAWIIARGHALSWPRGEMTAVVAITAAGLIFYTTIISKPGSVSGLTHLKYGVFVSLLGALLMLGGSALRASQTERPRKPPGVI